MDFKDIQSLEMWLQLKKGKEKMEDEIEKMSLRIACACRNYKAAKAKKIFRRILLISKLYKDTKGLMSDLSRGKPIYVVSSLFLHDSFNYLNKDADLESLHFVTGIQISNLIILDRMVHFELEIQNCVFASGNPNSVSKVLIELNEHAHKLLGYFHIHPGQGQETTFPSSTDLKFQKLLGRGHYPVIGAIFSRDGYVRFFSSKDFEIETYGNGVEKINGNLFRLVEIS